MKILAIAWANLRGTLRDRAAVIFIFAVPMVLILVVGMAFGGRLPPRLGIVDLDRGPFADRIIGDLNQASEIELRGIPTVAALDRGVRRGELQAGLVIPKGYEQALRSGGSAQLRFLARLGGPGQQVGLTVRNAVAQQGAVVRAVRFDQQERKDAFGMALLVVDTTAPQMADVSVKVNTPGQAAVTHSLGRFDLAASGQLLVWVFLNSLVVSVALIRSRQVGVSQRMLATPTRIGTIVVGEAMGRVALALVAGLTIMIGSALLFGVRWGNLAAASALILAFVMVGGGAGLVMGAVCRNEQQASALGILLGIGFSALGGCILPLEFFTPVVRAVAHLTPHAWANDAFAQLVRHGGGLTQIAPQLAVLVAYAAVLFVLGGWRLRTVLTR